MDSKQLGLFDNPVAGAEKKPKYVVFDFETGGTDPATNGLASIALIWLDEDLKECDRLSFILYEPDKKYEQGAFDVNGFTLEQLQRDGLRPETFIPALHQLIDGYIPVNHNSAFDCDFLNKRGWNITESCDTIAMRQELYRYKKAKLFMACADEGVELKDAHNAMSDTAATAALFRKYVTRKPEYANPRTIDFMRFKR